MQTAAVTWQPEGKRRRGRSRTTWRRTEKEMETAPWEIARTWQWIELVGESVFWPHAPNRIKKMRESFSP